MATGLERRHASRQAEPGRKVGRPKKYEGGWESANKRICIANETFDKWRALRGKLNLGNDDAMARFLLERVTLELEGERLVKCISFYVYLNDYT